MSDTVAIRLTPKQMSVTWPGLDFIVKAEATRRKHRTTQFCYPFQVYPPPPGFDRGTMHSEMMEIIIALWRTLRGKQSRGGRLQLNSIELRAAMFAVRVTLALKRLERNRKRKLDEETKGRFGVDRRSLDQLGKAARRTIQSLERHMKRANRSLTAAISTAEYESLVFMWREHLRWMRLHLVYFKPLPPIVRTKRRHQNNLDILMEMAVAGLRNEGYESPDAAELRRMMRLFVRSAVRGREGEWTVPFLLTQQKNFTAKWYLAKFVLRRLDLKRLP